MVEGIHHITAISSNINKTLEFYRDILGLRLVKQTVNFDSPDTYHFYFADKVGTPGTVITFFPFPDAGTGMRGIEQVTKVSFAIPKDSLGFWIERFIKFGVKHLKVSKTFNESSLTFFDSDGLQLELIATDEVSNSNKWVNTEIDLKNAINGIYSATLSINSITDKFKFLLENILKYKFKSKEENISRYENSNAEQAKYLDIFEMPGWPEGFTSAGTVHHIAFRVKDEDNQLKMREKILAESYNVTTVQERNYFKSIYFRDTNNILMEIATETPGFMIDEEEKDLGSTLKLPEWLEKYREKIERTLPTIDTKSKNEFSYIHKFIKKDSDKLLILFHGTGGDETDLINIAEEIYPDASILGLRGKISENGMLRFFERYPDGSFNLEDLDFRSTEINEFIKDFIKKENYKKEDIILLGFSNGANVIQDILLKFNSYNSVILFHPSLIEKEYDLKKFKNLKIFITTGKTDQFVTESGFNDIVDSFEKRDAKVVSYIAKSGHNLTSEEIEEARKFIKENIIK
jgi:predicted esterase/catechol 2,3-dioxygenase-like lactoylglutathione lyase family enzyme